MTPFSLRALTWSLNRSPLWYMLASSFILPSTASPQSMFTLITSISVSLSNYFKLIPAFSNSPINALVIFIALAFRYTSYPNFPLRPLFHQNLNYGSDILPSPSVSNFWTISCTCVSDSFYPKASATSFNSLSSIVPFLSLSKELKIC